MISVYILVVVAWLSIAALCRKTMGEDKSWYKLPFLVRVIVLWFIPFIFLAMELT